MSGAAPLAVLVVVVVLAGSVTPASAAPAAAPAGDVVLDGPGGLDGGTVRATTLLLPVRSVATLGGGVAVTADSLYVWNATLAVSGNSTVRTGYADLDGGSTTDDGSPGNLFVAASALPLLRGALPRGSTLFSDTLRGTGPGGPSSVSLVGGTLEGTLDQGGGAVVSVPGEHASRVDGNGRSASTAQLTLTATGAASRVGSPTNVLVTGTARLGGVVNLAVGVLPTPQIGYSEVLLNAPGGLAADVSQLTAPPGWRLRTSSTSIVAAYDGPGAAVSPTS